jgi:phage protein D
MPTTQAITSAISVEGADLPNDVVSQLESVVVTQRIAMPDTVLIAFRDPTKDVLGRAGIEIGNGLKVSVGSVRDDSPSVLFDGEVTAIEADYDSLGSRAIVRGFDRSHKLMAGCKSTTFKNVKYSDVVSQLANDAGLTPDVDETSGVQDHLIQANESDLDFIYRLARLSNRVVQVEGTTLHFKEPTPSASGPGAGDSSGEDPTQLWFGADLLEFRARISAVAQAASVEVRGWDPDQKQAVIGKADVTASHASVQMSASDLAGKAGGKTHTVTDLPVLKQEDADAFAAARSEQIGSAGFEAFALAVGSPNLRPGTAVSINGVDPALVGKWTIASARQEFGNGPYRTSLDLVGRHDRSLSGLLAKSGSAGGGDHGNRIPGVAVGIVTDNNDDSGLGRVKVKLPWLADDAETWWARLAAPGAGPDYGMVWVPQVGDEVLIAFDHGSVDHPYVLGGLWNGQDAAPLGDGLVDNGSVKRAGFISRSGHKLVFFDDDGDSGIALISAGNKFRISLNETKGALHIYADGDIKVEGTKNIELQAQGDFKVTAQNVTVQGQAQTAIKGQTVGLN